MKRLLGVLAALAALITMAVLLSTASCGTNPVNVPVRTFERPQRVDVVCMRVLGTTAQGQRFQIPPQPQRIEKCAPVPVGVDGNQLEYHLFAVVTQTTRGELAVVDLTAGKVVDLDRSTPGINFIPVGALPTDVAVAPDGQMVFVASAEVNKPAIYGVPSTQLLGDSQLELPREETPPAPRLTAWPSCALPQAPGAMVVVPRGAEYDLALVLPGDGRSPGIVALVDPKPLLPPAAGGTLEACKIKSAVELSSDVPGPPRAVARWDDGVRHVDGGAVPVDPRTQTCDPSAGDAGDASDEGGDADAGAPADAAAETGAAPVPTLPRPTQVARDGQILYVADEAMPLVHVIDLSSGAPLEAAPLVASSVLRTDRQVTVGSIAVSPTTRDYRRFLYAVDRRDGTIMVFDVTDPPTVPREPMRRPHGQFNPFQPPDRIAFNAPVSAVSFVRHDWVPTRATAPPTGELCNPNPNATGTPGADYRANSATGPARNLEPLRLRGIFAFATLSNGQLVTIDVDDWDAPCRRPDPMNAAFQASSLAIPQPAPGAGDIDPYHAPDAIGATNEAFFPVSAPHRPRSQFFLRRDPTQGVRIPHVLSAPTLSIDNQTRSTEGEEGLKMPIMLPTRWAFVETAENDAQFNWTRDPSYAGNPLESLTARQPTITKNPVTADFSRPSNRTPGVRFSFEDPMVHFDQDWTVTYEGALPGFDGVVATIADKQPVEGQLELASPSGFFCRRGVEDFAQGQARVRARSGCGAVPSQADQWTTDYVQIMDELLPPEDPYWNGGKAACGYSHEECNATFGSKADADSTTARDFPIVEAYEGRLVIGRYGYTNQATRKTSNRVVVPRDDTTSLAQMKCCFHNQVSFRVRTGGTWVTLGSAVGYLHHMTADANQRCVQSDDPRLALLNSRAGEIPTNVEPLVRTAPAAMRNPMFSFLMWAGSSPQAGDFTTSQRNLQWKFQTRGQFSPQTLALAANNVAVSPQSMLFIETLGQLAVVDGASQGLILVDLNSVAFAHAPYF